MAKPGRVEATESLSLLWHWWEASIVGGTPGCSFSPQWPRKKGCVCPVCRAGLERNQQPSAHLQGRVAGGIAKGVHVCPPSDSGLESSGTLVVSRVRLSLGPGCERLRPANPPALSCTCIQPHPAAPQTLRPKCVVVFTYSGSHRLQVLLAALQGPSSAPQQGEFLTGVWAGRAFRAEILALTSSVLKGRLL